MKIAEGIGENYGTFVVTSDPGSGTMGDDGDGGSNA
jgi:hypothetical protein